MDRIFSKLRDVTTDKGKRLSGKSLVKVRCFVSKGVMLFLFDEIITSHCLLRYLARSSCDFQGRRSSNFLTFRILPHVLIFCVPAFRFRRREREIGRAGEETETERKSVLEKLSKDEKLSKKKELCLRRKEGKNQF